MTAEQVWEVEPVLRRVVAARIGERAVVDDLVQDALEHLLAARSRLAPEMIIPYGVVTARNLASSYRRRAARTMALGPRLVDLDRPVEPDEAVLRDEEQSAMAAALARLPTAERDSLFAHDVLGTPVADLSTSESTAGTVRVRLSRSRAKLRVEYLLELRRVELPTSRCRPALLVLAGGDRGRQGSAATGQHLLGCDTCASLSEPLIERRRGLFVLGPLVAVRWVLHTARQHPLTTTATAAATAAAVAGGAVLIAGGAPAQAPPVVHRVAASASLPAVDQRLPLPTTPAITVVAAPATVTPAALTIDGQPLVLQGTSLASLVGQQVVAHRATVQSVVAHNGFWLGSDAAHRVWVELVGPLRPLRVVVGDHVSFTAPLVRQDIEFATSAGVVTSEGAAQLTAQAAHISVPTTSITVAP